MWNERSDSGCCKLPLALSISFSLSSLAHNSPLPISLVNTQFTVLESPSRCLHSNTPSSPAAFLTLRLQLALSVRSGEGTANVDLEEGGRRSYRKRGEDTSTTEEHSRVLRIKVAVMKPSIQSWRRERNGKCNNNICLELDCPFPSLDRFDSHGGEKVCEGEKGQYLFGGFVL